MCKALCQNTIFELGIGIESSFFGMVFNAFRKRGSSYMESLHCVYLHTAFCIYGILASFFVICGPHDIAKN